MLSFDNHRRTQNSYNRASSDFLSAEKRTLSVKRVSLFSQKIEYRKILKYFFTLINRYYSEKACQFLQGKFLNHILRHILVIS